MARTQEQFNKLPKWAQSLIQRLEAFESSNKKIAAMTSESASPSEVWISDYQAEMLGQKRYLPPHTRVAFQLDGRVIEFGSRRESGSTFVQAMLTQGPSGFLVITPEASNVVNISATDRRGVSGK
jgi:hypothetical protein